MALEVQLQEVAIICILRMREVRCRELSWRLQGHILRGEVGKESVCADLALPSRSPDHPNQHSRGDARFPFQASVARSGHFCSWSKNSSSSSKVC